ncbi:50S ribosomal protein L4 [Nesterenkonia natronophila]|uniref:Large ribosomal subunit protein uL4 n=1 Tax=Nesterenkonia natronophila TaxID=2174932 RepID=A0A3A4FHB5_9MICC|nr:50S ribosomal protein L4 [Nesterenkonia natronophila]RJN31695.1 50S ribosomal protein L4 [Nesterenkonia natronophila]
MSSKVSVDFPAEIFGVETNSALIHQVVVAQQAAARQGTHKTKTRSERSGTTAKPFRQKGTGRARQGSMIAPHMIGGGVVHGPQPRNYAQRTPKKMKAAALRGVLSDRARHGRIHVVDVLVTENASTKAAKEALAALGGRNRNWLVIIDRSDDLTALSVRNLPEVHALYADQLNTYDVLVSDDVVFTQAGYESFLAKAQGSTKEEAE